MGRGEWLNIVGKNGFFFGKTKQLRISLYTVYQKRCMLIGKKNQTILKLEENLSPCLPLSEKGYSRHKSDEINNNGFDYILRTPCIKNIWQWKGKYNGRS